MLVGVVYKRESEDVVEINEEYAGTVTPIEDSALASFTFIRQCLTSLAICQTRFILSLRFSPSIVISLSRLRFCHIL